MEPQSISSIIHLDMDSFYVSVERLLNPSLNGKPVAVGGSPTGRGVVASASYEARAYGVRSAMPMGHALTLCPELIVVQGTYSRYGDYSKRIREVLERFTPLVQMASQDEGYLDIGGTERLWGPPLATGQRIRDSILAETELPCSLGIASSKLVAKIASALCKPRGLLWIPHGSEELFLAPLPVRKMPGIGPKASEQLESRGLKTLGDIVRTGPDNMERIFGSHGREYYVRALGGGSSTVKPHETAKSISAEETFGEDTTDREFLESILANLAEKVASRVRKGGFHAATISLKYRYKGFETHTAAMTLPSPVNDEVAMLQVLRELLESRREMGRPIRLLGVCASGLITGASQGDLFTAEDHERRGKLNAAIDALRDRHGYGAVHRASSGGRHEEKNDHQWG